MKTPIGTDTRSPSRPSAWPSRRARWLLPRRQTLKATSCPSRNCSTNGWPSTPTSRVNNYSPTPGCSRKPFYNSISKSPKGTSRAPTITATNCIQRLESGSRGSPHWPITYQPPSRPNASTSSRRCPATVPSASRCPTASRPRCCSATLSSLQNGKRARPRFRSRWARTFTANRSSPTSPRCRTC